MGSAQRRPPAAAAASANNYFVILKLFPFEEYDAGKAMAARLRIKANLVETDKWTGLDSNRWALALGPFPSVSKADAALRALQAQDPTSAAYVQDGGGAIKG